MGTERSTTTLDNVLATLIDHRGRTPKKLGGDFSETGIRVLSAKNIKDGRITFDQEIRFVTPRMHDQWMPEKLKVGDILLTSEAPLGEVAYIQENSNYCLGQRLFALRADPRKLESRFLYYLLRSHVVQHRLRARATGTTAQGIRQSELVKVQVEIPTLSEQRIIAHILGTLDDKTELNRRMNETLEAMARAIFKSWFVDFDPVRAKAAGRQPFGMDAETAALLPSSFESSPLGKIPKGWKVNEIRERTKDIQYGLTMSASTDEVGPRFLRITDIQGGRVSWSQVPFCPVTPAEHEKYRIVHGDIFVARTGASTGENIYISEAPDAVFASYLVRLQFANLSLARVVGEFMRSPAYFDHVAGSIGGSAQPNASAQTLACALFAFPPNAVATQYARLVEPLDQRRVLNSQENETLVSLRDALLPKLISGEIRIKDAEKIVGEKV